MKIVSGRARRQVENSVEPVHSVRHADQMGMQRQHHDPAVVLELLLESLECPDNSFVLAFEWMPHPAQSGPSLRSSE